VAQTLLVAGKVDPDAKDRSRELPLLKAAARRVQDGGPSAARDE
jgi:hypothetical protein